MDQSHPGRRTDRFLLFRLAVIPVAFVLVAICRAGLPPGDPLTGLLYGVLGFYTVLASAAMALPPGIRARAWFLWAQVSLDFTISAVLIWSTGGVNSVFCPLLFINLFNATTVLRGREAMTFASISTVFLAAATFGGAAGTIPGAGQGPAAASAHLVAMGLALHVVALLGTRLTHGLRSIQNLQEEILENMAEGLVAVDSQLRILELNREARRIFGIPGGDSCTGLYLADLLRGDEIQEVLDAFQGTERRRFEFVRKAGGGRGLPVEGKISCLEIGDGHHRCRIGLFTDLSLKREIEDAERRIHKLEELHDMAMAIAHEIRNPLASIRGCVQELGRAAGRSSMEQRLVEIVCRESDRLDRIIEDFMNSSRKGPLSLRPVDMVKVLDETVIQLRNHPGFGTRTIEMESADGSAVVSGDWQRLKQVFLNLGMNAIEATDQSSGKIWISLRRQEFLALNRRRAGERRMVPGIEVEFADNGPGMTPEVRRMAFTPFFSTKENGHGLGLAIVHRVVHDHMGKVDVESGPEGGTRFKVWFPVQSREGVRPVTGTVKEVAHA